MGARGGGYRFNRQGAGRDRKLVRHRKQLRHLVREMRQQRVTVIPLRLFIRNHYAKVELAIARGRRQYDKRAHDARRSATREIQRATKINAR